MACVLRPRNVLLALEPYELGGTFCGHVVSAIDDDTKPVIPDDAVVFVVGDVAHVCAAAGVSPASVLAIQGMTRNVPASTVVVNVGKVPLVVPGIGVLYPRYFPSGCYERVRTAHTLQALTESSKPGESLRRGIYITRVTPGADDDLHFKLLRCSTNLSGPTDNRRQIDDVLISGVNELREHNFAGSAELDHVLAQEYSNTITDTGRSKKASISSHSDKTEDMPSNGTMAFVSFYSWESESSDAAVYTKLVWHLKDDVAPSETTPRKVSVTLGPGSVLLVSLDTNRLYRHETKPSGLPADKIPTRLSYVIRSSCTRAVFRSDKTHIVAPDNTLHELAPCSSEDMAVLRDGYLRENTTSNVIDYGFVPFSMNGGDYMRPIS